jgi:signal transduction histidine kinase
MFKDLEMELVPSFKLFQIKKCKILTSDNQDRYTIQLIDICSKIFYDDIKAQEEFMSLSTSTISHEMRNPLNSLISQCKIQD